MPFGKYRDFKDCVSKNKGKKNPAAYCAAIERSIIGSRAMAKKSVAGKKKR